MQGNACVCVGLFKLFKASTSSWLLGPGLRSFAAVGELYELNPCGGWVPVPRAQNSSPGWVGAPATLLKPLVATERLR